MYESTTGVLKFSGISIPEIIRLVEKGNGNEALLECLAVPPALPPLLEKLLPWRVVNGKGMHRLLRNAGKRRLTEHVFSKRNSLSAVEVLNYFFHQSSPLGYSLGQYFIKRFCQPRHLAALSLIETIPFDEKPVLDIACGLGHIEHYLTSRENAQNVIGTDMNFFHVWIARHWFAPKAFFVCANAGEGLPFADKAFSATICSDAYHYIPNRPELIQEIERCAPGRFALLTRVGNASVMPNEGQESTLMGYLEEMDVKYIECFGELELLKAYLQRRNPITLARLSTSELEETKWISFAWNISEGMKSYNPNENIKPHLVGKLQRNPIYNVIETQNGDRRLRFEFPDSWYAYENNAMLSYHKRLFLIKGQDWDEKLTTTNSEIEKELVNNFMLIGLPERFW